MLCRSPSGSAVVVRQPERIGHEHIGAHAPVLVDGLIADRRKGGIRGFLASSFRGSRQLTNVGIDLVQFENQDVTWREEFTQEFESRHKTQESYLREFVEEQLRNRNTYPTAQYLGLLQQFEARRVTDREWIFGLLGAALGAAVALIAS
jgi:hypothetical protein